MSEEMSEYQAVRAGALKKGYLSEVDLFKLHRALKNEVNQLERDLRWVAENRPEVGINPDVSLERARVEETKPAGYDKWLLTEGNDHAS